MKGYDELAELKGQAAQRWVAAVNAEGSYGLWRYAVAWRPDQIIARIEEVAEEVERSAG